MLTTYCEEQNINHFNKCIHEFSSNQDEWLHFFEQIRQNIAWLAWSLNLLFNNSNNSNAYGNTAILKALSSAPHDENSAAPKRYPNVGAEVRLL